MGPALPRVVFRLCHSVILTPQIGREDRSFTLVSFTVVKENHITPGRCAEMLSGCRKVVALTGAGISTAAGIPDFRGPHGLYVTRQYDAETVFDINAFVVEPGPFYEFTRDFLSVVDDLVPTATHRFLASLEEGTSCAAS